MSKLKDKIRRATVHVALGAGLATSVAGGLTSCDDYGNNQEQTVEKDIANDPYGNVALFEASRSKIKFALAFVENFSDKAYNDGTGTWTYGYGTTVKYTAKGTVEGHVKKGETVSMKQADIYKGRYLTYEVLPDIKKYIKVPMDEKTLIATCVFRYCIGGTNFKNSQYLKALNSGKKGKDLARYLTGFRKQTGVLNRCYFFAALLADKITYTDLLDLRAEGCYNLELDQIVKCKTQTNKKGKKELIIVVDGDNFAIWKFDDMETKLQIAKRPRKSRLGDCKLVKEIVPEYIWEEISKTLSKHVIAEMLDKIERNDTDAQSAQNALKLLEMSGYGNIIAQVVQDRWNRLTYEANRLASISNAKNEMA